VRCNPLLIDGPHLHVVAAVLTVFPGRASADPMKVQNMLFFTLRADALHLRLVAVDINFKIIVSALYRLFMLSGRVSFP
jgi:hypothetical protein